jgi:antitoxin YefM
MFKIKDFFFAQILGCFFLDKRVFVHYHVHIMRSKTYTEAREKLSDIIEKVCEDHDPLIITKRRDKAVVMISLEDYESMEETAYLLKSPRNAQRLLESIKELEEGRGTERDLVE